MHADCVVVRLNARIIWHKHAHDLRPVANGRRTRTIFSAQIQLHHNIRDIPLDNLIEMIDKARSTAIMADEFNIPRSSL